MDMIRRMIMELEAKTQRDELDEQKLQLLLRKLEELGENPTEEAAAEAAADVMMTLLQLRAQEQREETEPAEKNEPDCADEVEALTEEENMKSIYSLLLSGPHMSASSRDAAETVRSTLKSMGHKFVDYPKSKGVHFFEGVINMFSKELIVRIYVETIAENIRLEVRYPFLANKDLIYPLCRKLISEGDPHSYGALMYDEANDDLAYRYNFSISQGLHSDDFMMIYLTVTGKAFGSYDAVYQYATGNFSKKEKYEIIARAQTLIDALQ